MKRESLAILGACIGLLMATAVRAADEDANGRAPAMPSVQPPDAPVAGDFGISRGFTAVEPSSLVPYQSGFVAARTASGTGVYCDGTSTESRLVAQVQMPHGASLQFLRVWGLDEVAANMTVSMQQLCLPDYQPSQPVVTEKGSVSSTPGYWTESAPISGTIDNMSCTIA